MLLQPIFYRRYGVRLPNHLLKPNVFNIELFEFPKNSYYHYVDYDATTNGPDTNDYLFRTITKKIFVYHAQKLESEIGNPRRLSLPLLPLVRQWHMQNKRFRLMHEPTNGPQDELTLLMSNYSLLARAYKYPRSLYANYYKWKNIAATVWANIRQVASLTDRQQYFFFSIPQTLPSLQRLNMASERFNQATLRLFTTKESYFLLEIWKWLSSDYRKDSIIGQMDQAQLGRINLVLRDENSWICYNLGVLNSWRYVEGESPQDQKVKIAPEQMQRRFLRALMYVMSLRGVELPETGTDEEIDDVYPSTVAASPIPDESAAIELPTADDTGSVPMDAQGNEIDTADQTSMDEYERMLKNMDADLNELRVIEERTDALQEPDIPIDEAKEVSPVAKDQPVATKATKETTQTNLKRRLFSKDNKVTPDTDVDLAAFDKPATVAESVESKLNILADTGNIDAAEYRRKTKLLEKAMQLKAPGSEEPIREYVQIPQETLEISNEDIDAQIPDIATVPDKSMLQSTLLEFDKKYIKEVLPKDIVSMPHSLQKAGMIITDYDTEVKTDITGSYEMHTVRVTPVEGVASTLRFKLPVIQEDGTYESGGVKYRMRKARRDLPIRKITPTRVALSSYYGKSFVIRTEKQANNYANWLQTRISYKSLQDGSDIKELHPSNVYDSLFVVPKAYSSVAQTLKTFKYRQWSLNFDYRQRLEYFGEANIQKLEKNGSVLFGIDNKDRLLLMDRNSFVYVVDGTSLEPVGAFEEFLELDTFSAPIEYAECRIFAKNIPVALVLGYKLGLTKLLEMLKCDTRRVLAGQRQNLQAHEYSIVFADETLIASKDDALATMILAGFKPFDKTTRNYSIYSMDKPDVYLKLIEQNNLSIKYLREIDLLVDLFVDPITEQILKQMNEPTSYLGLVTRSCEMLMTDYHRDPLDMQEMRICGLERIAGAVYTETVAAIREHRSKANRKGASIDLNPYAVWKRVITDPAAAPSAELNPIQNLKETEAVTYGGTGGRDSRAMVKESRQYHPNDIGVISEATKDSSDVAINTYLTANPAFTSIRGLSKVSKPKETPPASLVSTSALVSVAADQDSAQRLNMVSIQQDHAVACNGYQAPYVRTGYEQVLAHRVSSAFATQAELDGKVLEVTKDSVVVEYKDGSKKGYPVGTIFSRSSDMTVPHLLKTDLKPGAKVKAGDILTYNSGFFVRDKLNPKAVVWKNSLLATVALLESRQTHEDACALSSQLVAKLTSRVTKTKDVTVEFNQAIHNPVKPGDKVEYDTVLCYIEEAVTSGANLLSKTSIDTLKRLSRQSPRAKVEGVVDKIEVYYNGDIEDMHPSLQALATESNKNLAKQARATLSKPVTGLVDESFRIKGEPLLMDTLVIRFYITHDAPSGLGDKFVFANQLKTICSEVMDYDVKTESGKQVDAFFGAQSIFNRIVNSAFILGTTNTLLGVIGKKAADIYNGK